MSDGHRTTGHRHALDKENQFGVANDPSFTKRLTQGQRFELIASMLVEYGADITLVNSSGESPLMIAAHYGLTVVAQALTKTDAELRAALEAKDMQRGPDAIALHQEPNKGFLEGALNTPYKQVIDGVTQGALFPLMEAARQGNVAVLKVYIAAGADPQAQDGAGRSVLFFACEGETAGHVAAVTFLCGQCGVDVNHTAQNGETALMQSARLGFGEHVSALLLDGADASMTDAAGQDARAIASAQGTKASGALAALMAMEDAVLANDFEAVLTMVKRGNYPIDYTISRPNESGDGQPTSYSLITPLMRACEVGATAAVGDIIAMGADVNAAPDDDGINALMMSAIVGHVEAARLLLDNGALVDQGETRGLTSLHLAALYGHEDFVCALVQDYGASINIKSKSGNTALSCASLKGNLGVVDALVSLGAFVTSTNNKGLSPLDLARSQGHSVIVDALLVMSRAILSSNFVEVARLVNNKNFLIDYEATIAPIAADVRTVQGLSETDEAATDANAVAIEALVKTEAEEQAGAKAETEAEANDAVPPRQQPQEGQPAAVVGAVGAVGADGLIKAGKTYKKPRGRNTSGLNKGFQLRYAELDGKGVLSYFKSAAEAKKGPPSEDSQIDVVGATVVPLGFDGKVHSYEVTAANGDKIVLGQDTSDDAKAWIKALTSVGARDARTSSMESQARASRVDSDRSAAGPGALTLSTPVIKPKPMPEIQSHTALTKACFEGDPEAAANMLKLGASVNFTTTDGSTAFMDLCAGASRFPSRPEIAPYLALAELLLQHGGDHTCCDGELLCMAVMHREFPLLRRLLALGDGEQVVREVYADQTALRIAVEAEDMETLTILIAAYSGGDELQGGGGEVACEFDIDKRHGPDAVSALMLAVRKGYVDIARKLIDTGASIHMTDTGGRSPLMHAAATGQTAAVKLLVDEGCQVNHGSNAGQTALMLAAAGAYKDCVSKLIFYGAFVPAKDKNGMTARDLALLKVSPTLSMGFPDPDVVAGREMSAAEAHTIRASRGKSVVVGRVTPSEREEMAGRVSSSFGALSEAELVVNLLSEMDVAIEEGDFDTVANLVRNGNYPIDHEAEGVTPFVKAMTEENSAALVNLVELGSDVNYPLSTTGERPLMYGVRLGNVDMVKILLNYGANVDLLDKNGNGPLTVALTSDKSRFVKMELVNVLLAHNAGVLHENKEGATPFIQAVMDPDVSFTSLFISHRKGHSFDLDHRHFGQGLTGLMVAARDGHHDTVRVLCQAGAKVDLQDNQSKTALFHASLNGHTTIVQSLLQNNGKITLSDSSGCSPLMAAADEGHVAVGVFATAELVTNHLSKLSEQLLTTQRELYETRLTQERMGRIGMSSICDQIRAIDHSTLRGMPQAERVVLEDALKQALSQVQAYTLGGTTTPGAGAGAMGAASFTSSARASLTHQGSSRRRSLSQPPGASAERTAELARLKREREAIAMAQAQQGAAQAQGGAQSAHTARAAGTGSGAVGYAADDAGEHGFSITPTARASASTSMSSSQSIPVAVTRDSSSSDHVYAEVLHVGPSPDDTPPVGDGSGMPRKSLEPQSPAEQDFEAAIAKRNQFSRRNSSNGV